jgi:hypothetical protein
MMTLTPEERTEDLRKIYAWTEREVGKDGVFAWSAYDHPDFGPVEIGGLNPKFVVQNPPLHLLEDECVGVSTFLTRLGLSTAKLIIPSVQVSPIGEGLFRVVAEVSNAGFLPTSSTEKGKELLLEGVRASIAGSVQMVAGISPTLIGHLDGYGSQDAYSPPKSQRGYAEWVIQGTPGVSLTVTFEGPRSGRVSTTICLGEAEG